MAVTVVNSVLTEVKRRLGTKGDQTQLLTNAELELYINKRRETDAVERVAVRIGGVFYIGRPDEQYWSLDYTTAGVGTGIDNDYDEDTVNGVIELTSGVDADTTGKDVTCYRIDLDVLMADLFDAIAQSKDKLGQVVSIMPGAEINASTLAEQFRRASRRLKDRRWL